MSRSRSRATGCGSATSAPVHTPLTVPQRIGPTARSDAGTVVAVPYLFDDYERQHMLRSSDGGLTWTELAPEAFPQGHSIFRISFGYADPSELCKLP